MITKFSLHVEKWGHCTNCELSKTRNKIVISKGKIPCDILMVGEAPGESENITGAPFTGPAGKLLDFIVASSIPTDLRIAYTNLVCCLPRAVEGGKLREPSESSIAKCEPRLVEFIDICKPKYLVMIGKLATKYVKWENIKGLRNYTSISHPAWILRLATKEDRDLEILRSIADIKDIINA